MIDGTEKPTDSHAERYDEFGYKKSSVEQMRLKINGRLNGSLYFC